MKKTLIAVMLLAASAASPARGAEAPPPPEPYAVELKVGQLFKVCKSGEVICPVQRAICDDPKVADIVDTPDGAGFRAVGPGTTLCSAGGSFGPRRVFLVNVR